MNSKIDFSYLQMIKYLKNEEEIVFILHLVLPLDPWSTLVVLQDFIM